MNMDKYFMWIHYERLHNHNKAKHNKTVGIFLGIYCMDRRKSFYKNHTSFLPQQKASKQKLFEITYRQVCNIRRTLVSNKIVDNSDVVGASPVGAAPTTSSFST